MPGRIFLKEIIMEIEVDEGSVNMELRRITKDEKREVTDEDVTRVRKMLYDRFNALLTPELVVTEEMQAEMEIRYKELLKNISLEDTLAFIFAYRKVRRPTYDPELMKLSEREKRCRAEWWAYNTYGISNSHAQRLSRYEVQEAIEQIIWENS